jgi:ribose transport system permease protein
VVIVVVGIFGVLRPDTYMTASNLLSIAEAQSVTALLALSIIGVLIVGEFDLSFTTVFGIVQVLGPVQE